MEKKIAGFISIVLHPLLIPTYGFILLFNSKLYFAFLVPYQIKVIISLIIFVTTFLVPLTFVMIMVRRKMIGSLQMNDKQERLAPLIVSSVFLFLSLYMLHQLNISKIFDLFLLGSALSVVAAAFINVKEKISLHTLGTGGLTGALIGISIAFNINMLNLVVVAVLLSGLTGFARLSLNVHTPAEVYKGFFTGFIIMLVTFLIL